jgi:hypothetical protein
MKRIKFLAIALVMVAGAVASPAIASADHAGTPFLCPIVGDGVSTADGNNGSHGVSLIPEPPAGTSFLPGNNQAGPNANHSALNTDNPSNPDAGPGGNPDFSPIWPG